MLSKRKSNLFLIILLSFFTFLEASVNLSGKIISAKIIPEKNKVLPSEIIDVKVKIDFDKDNDEVLYINTFYGEIIGRDSSESNIETGKIFYPKEGQKTIKFQYKAPAENIIGGMDFISVWSASLKEEEEGEMSYKKIKELESKKILLVRPTFAILTYYELNHTSYGNTEWKREIKIKLKLNLKGGGAQSLYNIKSIEVLKYSGLEFNKVDERIEKKKLISVNPENQSPIVQLSFDSKGEQIISIRFPIIMTYLEWQGAASFTPPKIINIGPVSKDNKPKRAKDTLKSSENFRNKLSNKNSRKRRFAAFMKFLKTMNPPDFERKGGSGIGYCWGEGKYKTKLPYGIVKKSYKWEFFTDRK